MNSSRNTAVDAVQAGLRYLMGAQRPDGLMDSFEIRTTTATERRPSRNIGAVLVVAPALRAIRSAEARRIVTRCGRYLATLLEGPGLWRWSLPQSKEVYPLDVDDTACAAMLVGWRCPQVLFRRNVKPLLAVRNADGLFLTWMGPGSADSPVDCVVNANAVWYLGQTPATARCVEWLLQIADRGSETQRQRFYPDPMMFVHAYCRAACESAPELLRGRAAMVERCRRVAVDAPAHSVVAIAHAATAVARLAPDEIGLQQSLMEDLLARQNGDGSWPMAAVCQISHPRPNVPGETITRAWGAESASTALACEAVYRLAGLGRRA